MNDSTEDPKKEKVEINAKKVEPVEPSGEPKPDLSHSFDKKLESANEESSSSSDIETVESSASEKTSEDQNASEDKKTSHSHGHSHGHNHDVMADWEIIQTHPLLKFTLFALGAIAIATVIAVVILWPSDEGRESAFLNAAERGLAYDLHHAEVKEVTDSICSYSNSQDGQRCRTIIVIPEGGLSAGELYVLAEYNLQQQDVPEVSVGERIVLGETVTIDNCLIVYSKVVSETTFGGCSYEIGNVIDVSTIDPEKVTSFYFYEDRERRSILVWLAVIFAVVVIALSRSRGLLALLSMGITVAILIMFIAPSILDGNDPILVAVVASSVIAFFSLYLTHGFTPMTTLALAGTLGALLVTFAISAVFFELARFTGLYSEDGLALAFLQQDLNISSLLLAGAVLGALGALDDITITQAATIAELHEQNPSMTTSQLFASGIKVGREHIASTVNTLLLAYAGAALPVILIISASARSLSDVANGEEIAVEITRTLCGSIGLVTAVPVTTFLAALLVGTSSENEHEDNILKA